MNCRKCERISIEWGRKRRWGVCNGQARPSLTRLKERAQDAFATRETARPPLGDNMVVSKNDQFCRWSTAISTRLNLEPGVLLRARRRKRVSLEVSTEPVRYFSRRHSSIQTRHRVTVRFHAVLRVRCYWCKRLSTFLAAILCSEAAHPMPSLLNLDFRLPENR